MNSRKKHHSWLKEIIRWQQEEEKPLSIRPHQRIKRPHQSKSPPKRYYVGKSYPDTYLTPRELEISILLVQGNRYKTIAQKLSLSPRSVEFYIQNLRLKFHCSDRKSLIDLLRKLKIVQNLK